MSISVIESAYATYLGDKRVTGTQMAVLICLAKFANNGTLETFPSDSKVAQYSHFAPSAVLNARKALKKIGAIDWVPGGKTRDGGLISNHYVFPFYKPSKQDRGAAQQSAGVERYESLSTDSVDKYKTNASTAFANEVSTDAPTPPRGGPTPSGDDPHPSTRGDPPLHEVSNTEINSKNNSERNGKVLCANISSLSDELADGFSLMSEVDNGDFLRANCAKWENERIRLDADSAVML